MKRKIALLMVVVLIFNTLSGCSDNKKEETIVNEPDITQIRNICNLATLECYYHNVAKSVKEAGDSFVNLGEKDRTFWIEYTGVAKLGIDMSKVKMEINGTDVVVTLPEAEVLSISIDNKTLDETSYIATEDGFNKNKITAEDQTGAISKAQENMELEVKNNSSLLLRAQNRAKTLIENYINQLGKASGVEYNIKWVYLEEEQTLDSSEVMEETEQ